KVLGLSAFMLGLSPRLTLLALLEVPLAVAAQKVYDSRHQALQRAVLDAAADTGAEVQEAISAIETVRAFAGEEEEERRYGQALGRTLRLRDWRDTEKAIFLLIQRVRLAQGDGTVSGWDTGQGRPRSSPSPQALQLAVRALVLYCGHQQLREGTLTAGGLIAFILYQADAGKCVQVRPGSVCPA
ncbi:TAP2 protein, partial [Alectura lathami]|nr:TAP2 protein [Alectura lathami]